MNSELILERDIYIDITNGIVMGMKRESESFKMLTFMVTGGVDGLSMGVKIQFSSRNFKGENPHGFWETLL